MTGWRGRKSGDLKDRKVGISVTLTERAIIYLQDKKATHESRSNYLEKLMWMGVQQEEMARALKGAQAGQD